MKQVNICELDLPRQMARRYLVCRCTGLPKLEYPNRDPGDRSRSIRPNMANCLDLHRSEGVAAMRSTSVYIFHSCAVQSVPLFSSRQTQATHERSEHINCVGLFVPVVACSSTHEHKSNTITPRPAASCLPRDHARRQAKAKNRKGSGAAHLSKKPRFVILTRKCTRYSSPARRTAMQASGSVRTG